MNAKKGMIFLLICFFVQFEVVSSFNQLKSRYMPFSKEMHLAPGDSIYFYYNPKGKEFRKMHLAYPVDNFVFDLSTTQGGPLPQINCKKITFGRNRGKLKISIKIPSNLNNVTIPLMFATMSNVQYMLPIKTTSLIMNSKLTYVFAPTAAQIYVSGKEK